MIISIPNYKDETEAVCASILSVLMQQYFANPEEWVKGKELEHTETVIANCFFDYTRTDVFLLARTLTERGYCKMKTLSEIGVLVSAIADECGNCYQLTKKGIATYNASPDRE